MRQTSQYNDEVKSKAFSRLFINNNPDVVIEYFLTIAEEYVINRLEQGYTITPEEYLAVKFIPDHISKELERLRKDRGNT